MKSIEGLTIDESIALELAFYPLLIGGSPAFLMLIRDAVEDRMKKFASVDMSETQTHKCLEIVHSRLTEAIKDWEFEQERKDNLPIEP